MAAAQKGNSSGKPTSEKEVDLSHGYAKTRKSLIARLENWEDQRTWDDFYQTYWKLIYSVGIKAGLRHDEAFDTVQETILSIAKQSKKNLYDPDQGSFKTWLMNMTRWRINDQFRKRKKDTAMPGGGWDDDRKTAIIERFEDPKGDVLRADVGCRMAKEHRRYGSHQGQGSSFPKTISNL